MTVKGHPVPKPDPKCFGRGGVHRLSIDKNNKGYAAWKARLTAAGSAIHDVIGEPLTGPVGVEITYTMTPPKKLPTGRVWPAVRCGDSDKLARAALDAFTDASLWQDDSQAVDLHVTKVYPSSPHPDALDTPGALIRIWRIHE